MIVKFGILKIQKSKKIMVKNSFRTYVIYGRQAWNCVDRVHDIPKPSCFHHRGCRRSSVSSRRRNHEEGNSTPRINDVKNQICYYTDRGWEPCLDLPSAAVESKDFTSGETPVRTNFLITAHQHTAGSFSTLVSSAFVFLRSRMQWKKANFGKKRGKKERNAHEWRRVSSSVSIRKNLSSRLRKRGKRANNKSRTPKTGENNVSRASRAEIRSWLRYYGSLCPLQ